MRICCVFQQTGPMRLHSADLCQRFAFSSVHLIYSSRSTPVVCRPLAAIFLPLVLCESCLPIQLLCSSRRSARCLLCSAKKHTNAEKVSREEVSKQTRTNSTVPVHAGPLISLATKPCFCGKAQGWQQLHKACCPSVEGTSKLPAWQGLHLPFRYVAAACANPLLQVGHQQQSALHLQQETQGPHALP